MSFLFFALISLLLIGSSLAYFTDNGSAAERSEAGIVDIGNMKVWIEKGYNGSQSDVYYPGDGGSIFVEAENLSTIPAHFRMKYIWEIEGVDLEIDKPIRHYPFNRADEGSTPDEYFDAYYEDGKMVSIYKLPVGDGIPEKIHNNGYKSETVSNDNFAFKSYSLDGEDVYSDIERVDNKYQGKDIKLTILIEGAQTSEPFMGDMEALWKPIATKTLVVNGATLDVLPER